MFLVLFGGTEILYKQLTRKIGELHEMRAFLTGSLLLEQGNKKNLFPSSCNNLFIVTRPPRTVQTENQNILISYTY